MKMPDIPLEIARKVIDDMRAFYAEQDGHKRDGIAAETLERLRPYQPKYGKKIRLMDVKELFQQMHREG
jgi:hypothetical protein